MLQSCIIFTDRTCRHLETQPNKKGPARQTRQESLVYSANRMSTARQERVEQFVPVLAGVVGGVWHVDSVDQELGCTGDRPAGTILPGIAGSHSDTSVSEALHYPGGRSMVRGGAKVVRGTNSVYTVWWTEPLQVCSPDGCVNTSSRWLGPSVSVSVSVSAAPSRLVLHIFVCLHLRIDP